MQKIVALKRDELFRASTNDYFHHQLICRLFSPSSLIAVSLMVYEMSENIV